MGRFGSILCFAIHELPALSARSLGKSKSLKPEAEGGEYRV